jgi:hypothetical protein
MAIKGSDHVVQLNKSSHEGEHFNLENKMKLKGKFIPDKFIVNLFHFYSIA